MAVIPAGKKAFQDQIPGNHCFGCGPDNAQGLRIKSFWADNPGEAVCEFQAEAHHNAGADNIVNGGIIATVIDCHCICTAIAAAYADAGREIGSAPLIWFATAGLELSYQAPAQLRQPMRLSARVTETSARRTVVTCELRSNDIVCTTAKLIGVRVAPEWRTG